MRSKSIKILPLALIIGIFFMPVTARAGGGAQTPLSIAVWIDGGYLHVLAAEEDSIATVYINQSHVGYIAGGVSVVAKDYADSNGKLAVYAADKNGNTSNTVILHVADDPEISVETPAPTPTPPPKPLTPDGTGTVLDNAESGDGKEFYTITTANKNVFYLIIDRQRTNNNVYFLNPVTEQDLLALADVSKVTGIPSVTEMPVITATPTSAPVTPEASLSVTPEPVPNESGGVNPQLIIVLLLIGAGFIAAYYFLVIRPKRQNKAAYKSEGEDTDDENGSDGDDDMDNGFDYDEDEIPYDKPESDDED